MQTLIRQLEFASDGTIAYSSFIDSLSTQTVAWWTQHIHNNNFEHRHRVSRKGNMSTVAFPRTFSFVRAATLKKLQLVIAHESPAALADRVFGAHPETTLGKSQLRQALLSAKYPPW